MAALPRRPGWRDSDPRWRRHVLAGMWILVLFPLMDVLQTFGWDASVPVPGVWDFYGNLGTLDRTLFSFPGVYNPLVFCVGVVLLFSNERGRRRGRLDWTRRWGVLCTYVIFLLSAAQVLFIAALVLSGIAANFQSMPPKYQPDLTPLFVDVSSSYLRYGPHPTPFSGIVLVAFSSIAILLACMPLFDALRSSGPKRVAAFLLAPLAFFALMHLAQTARYWIGFSIAPSADVFRYAVYFWQDLPIKNFAGLPAGMSGTVLPAIFVEAVKWCMVLAIALWLTVAQLAAWKHGRKTIAA